jgi:hypothetical protein
MMSNYNHLRHHVVDTVEDFTHRDQQSGAAVLRGGAQGFIQGLDELNWFARASILFMNSYRRESNNDVLGPFWFSDTYCRRCCQLFL